ncbi:MAG: glycosyltransferase family 39 protein [Bacteroidota bacterium]
MLKKSGPWTWLGNFRIWLLIFGLIRLIGITQPPLEPQHSWRQILTIMVADNFAEVDPNPLYPRLDMNGSGTGITGLEFPIFSYLIFLGGKLLGSTHWIGRLINLLVSSLGVWFFYSLIKRHLDSRLAFFSAMLLLSSIWFSFSRKSMPDTFSVSLALVAIHQAFEFLYEGKARYGIRWVGIGALALLSKLPAIIPMAVLLLPLIDRRVPLPRKLWFLAGTGLLLLPALWWYGVWVGHLGETYGFLYSTPLYDPNTLNESLAQLREQLEPLAKQFYFFPLFAFSGTAAVILGVGRAFHLRDSIILTIGGLTLLAMVAFMLKLGEVFAIHNYYLIPFVPGLCLMAGYGLQALPLRPWGYVMLGLIMIEGMMNQQHDLWLKEKYRYPLSLAELVSEHTEVGDLVVVLSDSGHPQNLYFSDRKGWLISGGEASQATYLEELAGQGASLLIVDQHLFPGFSLVEVPLYQDEHYSLYSLE